MKIRAFIILSILHFVSAGAELRVQDAPGKFNPNWAEGQAYEIYVEIFAICKELMGDSSCGNSSARAEAQSALRECLELERAGCRQEYFATINKWVNAAVVKKNEMRERLKEGGHTCSKVELRSGIDFYYNNAEGHWQMNCDGYYNWSGELNDPIVISAPGIGTYLPPYPEPDAIEEDVIQIDLAHNEKMAPLWKKAFRSVNLADIETVYDEHHSVFTHSGITFAISKILAHQRFVNLHRCARPDLEISSLVLIGFIEDHNESDAVFSLECSSRPEVNFSLELRAVPPAQQGGVWRYETTLVQNLKDANSPWDDD